MLKSIPSPQVRLKLLNFLDSKERKKNTQEKEDSEEEEVAEEEAKELVKELVAEDLQVAEVEDNNS